MNVYVGIDVACAKRKALPVCFVTPNNGTLTILSPPAEFLKTLPRGLGNREVESKNPFGVAAKQTAIAFQNLDDEIGWKIKRVAIDAPAGKPIAGKRTCEMALTEKGIHCIFTPDDAAWSKHLTSARDHLHKGRPTNRLPAANLIWMLYGFELFRELRNTQIGEVIEVYPYAIVCGLLSFSPHKKTPEGYRLQLNAVAGATGFEPKKLEEQLKLCVRGTKDDRLDAYMAAWVASLAPNNRSSYGNQADPDDTIWCPR